MGVLSVKIRVYRNKVSKINEIIRNNEIMGKLIELTKMDTRKILVNTALIETVEGTPDTVVIFQSGRKLIVKEKLEEISKLFNS